MATMPPTSERVPTSSPPSEKVEKPTRAVKTAPKAAVRAAIKRITRDHRELIKDLAK
jgi:hypothetical protein